MPETVDVPSVVDAAAQAAASGNHVLAEQLLREVARLQEASLGPLHPDLANTLNNLGVVCEITGKPDDAERYYRQAYTIAAAALAPDHPFLATSRKNLEDFCAARGMFVDWPALAPAMAVQRDAHATGSAAPQPAPSTREAPTPASPGRRSRSLAIGALTSGVLLLAFVALVTWYLSNAGVEPTERRTEAPPPGTQATPASRPAEPLPTDVRNEIATRDSRPVAVEPPTPDTAPTTVPGKVSEQYPAPSPSAGSEAVSAAGTGTPAVAGAYLCRDLSFAGTGAGSGDWRCDPPGLPVAPGPLFFYTRVKSPADLTVEHRWYRGDRLRQAVQLRIRANTTSGYRTYSRQSIDTAGAGDWRVELRTSAGVLLHEERFVVR